MCTPPLRIHPFYPLPPRCFHSLRVARKVSLRLQATDGSEVVFKIKGDTKLGKIFAAYAAKTGEPIYSFKLFSSGGNVIKYEDTPDSIGLEDGETIDAMMQQGGC